MHAPIKYVEKGLKCGMVRAEAYHEVVAMTLSSGETTDVKILQVEGEAIKELLKDTFRKASLQITEAQDVSF